MNNYQTTATVQEHGRILIAGVPFAPGSEVDVSISPKARPAEEVTPGGEATLAAARDQMRQLFRTVKGFRNSPRIPREELHERGRLH